MANQFDKNPIKIDTAGAGIATPLMIAGIVIIANADTWVVDLRDAEDGDYVFEAKSDVANHRYAPFATAAPFPVSGLWAKTLTNVDRVLVYLARVQGRPQAK